MAQTTIQGSFLGDATVTGAKIGADFISAQTALSSGLATADELIVSDAGVIKKMAMSVWAATTITFTNKSIDLGDNTLTGSVAEFNTALQSESFATLGGTETLAAKTLTTPTIASTGWTNATHAHGANDTGGTLDASVLGAGTLPAARIGDDSIVEAKLDVSNAPSNGQFLQAQSGEGGGLTWAAAGGGTTVNGTTDNAILTYINSSSEFTAESELKYNGAGNLYYSRAGTVQFDMVPTGGSSQAWALSARTDGTFRITNDTDGSIDFKIDGDGVIAKARQPGFQVYLGSDSGTSQNGDVDIVPFNSTSGGRDQGGYFNTTGSNETIRGITVLPYQFLAPVAGFYLLTCFIAIAGQGSGADRVEVRFDVVPNGGSQVSYNCRVTTASLTTELRVPFSMVVYVVADAQIRCMAGTYGAANQQGTRKEGSWFSGILLG